MAEYRISPIPRSEFQEGLTPHGKQSHMLVEDIEGLQRTLLDVFHAREHEALIPSLYIGEVPRSTKMLVRIYK
jgi:hypothetical protein